MVKGKKWETATLPKCEVCGADTTRPETHCHAECNVCGTRLLKAVMDSPDENSVCPKYFCQNCWDDRDYQAEYNKLMCTAKGLAYKISYPSIDNGFNRWATLDMVRVLHAENNEAHERMQDMEREIREYREMFKVLARIKDIINNLG